MAPTLRFIPSPTFHLGYFPLNLHSWVSRFFISGKNKKLDTVSLLLSKSVMLADTGTFYYSQTPQPSSPHLKNLRNIDFQIYLWTQLKLIQANRLPGKIRDKRRPGCIGSLGDRTSVQSRRDNSSHQWEAKSSSISPYNLLQTIQQVLCPLYLSGENSQELNFQKRWHSLSQGCVGAIEQVS